ncbi:PREDICTED: zinc finger protein 350-like [Elephantulus edwardii]|uniref:zinc finger protein 350-like n=1 Tax=Elephantulus edwardii TaxID=28737 RepID=UPI0003F062C3|nr:PREDICTED: zinc finger protein 350-like [Elephantulus edwardii]
MSQVEKRMVTAQEALTFSDVSVKFTGEEWELLDSSQKALHHNVMLENYRNLVSIGYQPRKPDALSRLEEDEQPQINFPEYRSDSMSAKLTAIGSPSVGF